MRSLPLDQANRYRISELVSDLDISRNDLQALPAAVLQFSNLRNLSLSRNYQLSELPEEIGNLRELRELDLGNTSLEVLPAEIGQLNQLRKLHIPRARLRSLPLEIGKLAELRSLHLSNNGGIRELPKQLGQLTQLQELFLENNLLSNLPPEIEKLQMLTTLRLAGNPELELPMEILGLSNLAELNLSYDSMQANSDIVWTLRDYGVTVATGGGGQANGNGQGGSRTLVTMIAEDAVTESIVLIKAGENVWNCVDDLIDSSENLVAMERSVNQGCEQIPLFGILMHSYRDNDSQSVSTTLLAGMRSDDSVAWCRIDALFRDEVHRWFIKQWGISHESAGDLVQNVFVKVHGSIGRFDHSRAGATFRGWLWTIAKHAAMDHFDKVGKQPKSVGGSVHLKELANLPESPPSDDQDELNSKLVRLIDVIKADVAESTFQIFQQTVIDNRESSEVAQELEMKPSTVREAKRRVLQRLRDEWIVLYGAWPFDHPE